MWIQCYWCGPPCVIVFSQWTWSAVRCAGRSVWRWMWWRTSLWRTQLRLPAARWRGRSRLVTDALPYGGSLVASFYCNGWYSWHNFSRFDLIEFALIKRDPASLQQLHTCLRKTFSLWFVSHLPVALYDLRRQHWSCWLLCELCRVPVCHLCGGPPESQIHQRPHHQTEGRSITRYPKPFFLWCFHDKGNSLWGQCCSCHTFFPPSWQI